MIGVLVKPQKINIGWKKYKDKRTKLFSSIWFVKIFLAIKPIKIKKYMGKTDSIASIINP